MAYLSEIKRLFNKRSEKYDSIYVDESNQLLHKEKHRRANLTIEWGGRYLGDLNNGRVLDVGCGIGNILFRFRDLSPNVEAHGIDISSKMIEKAKDYAQNNGYHDVKFEVGELSSNFGKYNLVVSLGVIGYQNNQIDFLQDLADRVEQNGVIIFTVGNGDSLIRSIRTILEKIKDLVFRSKTLRFRSMKHAQFQGKLISMGFIPMKKAYLSFGLGLFSSKIECKLNDLVSKLLQNHALGRYFSLTTIVAYKRIPQKV